MGKFTVETTIARQPDEVFAYMSNYENELEWQAGHVIEVVPEPAGPIRQGTRIHKVRKTPNGELRFTMEVTSVDKAARSWEELTTSSMLTGSINRWQVLAEGNGSRVRLNATFRAKGLGKLLLPLITRSAEKGMHAEFANLKHILEGEPEA